MEYLSGMDPEAAIRYIDSRRGDHSPQFTEVARLTLDELGVAITPTDRSLLITLDLERDFELDNRQYGVQALHGACISRGGEFEPVHAFLEQCRTSTPPHHIVHIELPLISQNPALETARAVYTLIEGLGNESAGVEDPTLITRRAEQLFGDDIAQMIEEADFLAESHVGRQREQKREILTAIVENLPPELEGVQHDIEFGAVSLFIIFGAAVTPTRDGVMITIDLEFDREHGFVASRILPVYLRTRLGIQDTSQVESQLASLREDGSEGFHLTVSGISPAEYKKVLSGYLTQVGIVLSGGDAMEIDQTHLLSLQMALDLLPDVRADDETEEDEPKPEEKKRKKKRK